jgi:hypothetical protein
MKIFMIMEKVYQNNWDTVYFGKILANSEEEAEEIVESLNLNSDYRCEEYVEGSNLYYQNGSVFSLQGEISPEEAEWIS